MGAHAWVGRREPEGHPVSATFGDSAKPRVRCKSTGYSSQRFGPCEVCREPVGDSWIGTADNGGNHVFGHEVCVRRAIGLKQERAA